VMVQELPLSFFDQLEAGDILFIDSTHSVKTGSDAVFLCVEVLPRLKPGVLIHFHDIYLPFVYPRDVLMHYFDWQETALLLALMKGSVELQPLCCLSALHYDAPGQIREVLKDYEPQENADDGLAAAKSEGHFPSSMWLQIGRGVR
jgi:hypothetical protein